MTPSERFLHECRGEFAFLVEELGFTFQGPVGKKRRFVCEFSSPIARVEVAYDPPDPDPSVVLHFPVRAGEIKQASSGGGVAEGVRSKLTLREIMLLRGAPKEELRRLSSGPSRRLRDSRAVLASNAAMLKKYGSEYLR